MILEKLLKRFLLTALFLTPFVCASAAYANDEFICQAMTVEGDVLLIRGNAPKTPVQEGDILRKGDRLEVGDKAHIDVAYDRHWNNITRIRENTRVTLVEIFPTGLFMDEGSIFARLSKLPAKATFEVRTPTAVAGVRGSEFETQHRDDVTEVRNFSDSPVEVFGIDSEGNLSDPVRLEEHEKTEIPLNEPPVQPEPMTPEEIAGGQGLEQGLKDSITEAEAQGRLADLPDIQNIEKVYQEQMRDRIQDFKEAESGQGSMAGPEGPKDPNAPPMDPNMEQPELPPPPEIPEPPLPEKLFDEPPPPPQDQQFGGDLPPPPDPNACPPNCTPPPPPPPGNF